MLLRSDAERIEEDGIMEKQIKIKADTLFLPICAGKKTELMECFCEGKKVMELQVPVDIQEKNGYHIDYYARFPVKQFIGKTLILRGHMPESFLEEIRNDAVCDTAASDRTDSDSPRRPRIHFTVQTGWINDPNGLVYKDGYFHLYFQYNPYDIAWENMCWGHAVSRDLLHWTQQDTVLYPDEHGTVFSGSGVVNEHGMLGLPESALLFFYTAAGACNRWCENDNSTQRLAYSLDGGATLQKMNWELATICKENRDPKVFWHEESRAYVMVLWLEKNDFGILRSDDLRNWRMTDRLTLDQAWECPDLIRLPGADGGAEWMFWSADGYYFWGTFDGFRFQTDGIRHEAYLGKLPYAAQTYAGVSDRVISVPWLRLPNRGTLYTGAMGLPRELSVVRLDGEKYLAQSLPLEWRKNCVPVDLTEMERGERLTYQYHGGEEVIELRVCLREDAQEMALRLGKDALTYDKKSGILSVNGTDYPIGCDVRDFSFLLDDVILEVTAKYDTIIGVFELQERECIIEIERDAFEKMQMNRM